MEITQLAGSVGLFFLMLIVGLGLTPEDFKRVLASPGAVVAGTLGQVALLPAMTWVVVWAFGLTPVFAAGAILVAVSPGAGASNIMAALARANVALSVTLTAIASALAVVTLPFVAALTMRVVFEDEAAVDVPVANLALQLGLSVLLPILFGMWLRARHPRLADRIAPVLQRVTILVLVVVLVLSFAFADSDQLDFDGGSIAFLAAGVWTLAAMAIGWSIASLLRLPRNDRVTFMIEFSARNVGVASIVALSGLGRLDLSLFSGIYASIGFPMVVALVLWRRRITSEPRRQSTG